MTFCLRNQGRPLNSRGSAFLEIMLVCSVLAGIIIAVTMGVHTLGRVSIAGESGIRAADVQMTALLTSLEKDFAYADYVVTLKGKGMVSNTTSWPPQSTVPSLPQPVPAGFSQKNTPEKTNEDYAVAWSTSLVDFSAANIDAHSELHFIRGGEVIAIFTVAWNTTLKQLILTRYAGGATNSGAAVGSRMQQLIVSSPELIVGSAATGPTKGGWVYETPVTALNAGNTAFISLAVPNLRAFSSVWADTDGDRIIDMPVGGPGEIDGLTVTTQAPDPLNDEIAPAPAVMRWNLDGKLSGPRYTLLVRNKSKL